MNYIDILKLIKAHGGSLQKVRVYGRIYTTTKRPSNLLPSCKTQNGGTFAVMDVIAVDLSYYAQYLKEKGIYNKTNKYFVNGCICMYINSSTIIPDWYCSYGTLRLGKKNNDNYVVLFDFRKNGSNWVIAQNALDDIEYKVEFGEGSPICNYIEGISPKPDSLSSLQEMMGVLPQENEPLRPQPIMEDLGTAPIVDNTVKSSALMGVLEEKDRDRVEPFSSRIVDYKTIVSNTRLRLDNSINALSDKYASCNDTLAINLARNIRDNMRFKPVSTAKTGKMLLKGYLEQFGKLSTQKYCGVQCSDFMIDYFDQIVEYYERGADVSFGNEALQLFNEAFADSERFFEGVLSQVTKIDFGLSRSFLEMKGVFFSKIVTTNPYILFVLGFISFKDAESLALYFNNVYKKVRYRNMCILHNKITSKDDNDTMYLKDDIVSSGLPIRVTQYRCENGLSKAIVSNIECYFTKEHVTDYDFSSWSKGRGMYVTSYMTKHYIELAIKDYCDYGLGVVLDDKYITSLNLLDREVYVYEELWQLGEKSTGHDSDLIDEYIDEYESEIGFKLEKEQRMGVHLLERCCGVLTGGAGSGKTTTVDCMVYVKRKLDQKCGVKYGAPTGKAAKVLQGVVKEPVKTLHSLGGLSIGEDTILDTDEYGSQESNTIYFFDETSMVTIGLISKVLKKVKGANIYFIGDVHQLNAIGKGMVLKNLLRFLPCVFLKVSKRSAENSGITYNSRLINSNSLMPLVDKSDFIRIPCPDADIPNIVEDIARKYLGYKTKRNLSLPEIQGVAKDDIQIVSPFVKSSYTWGTTQLNKRLQPLFNTNGNYNDRFWSGENYFIKGDRVIHTKLNLKEMQWYSSYKGGNFQKIYGYGIANGEVGKLVDFIHSSKCSFYDEVEDMPDDDFGYPENIRKDEAFTGYFVVVEYYDYMQGRPFYILYRAFGLDNPEKGFELRDKDIRFLELFYAGSVHKLQGSQSKIVICCLGIVRTKNFLTRNMLYTMVTRGSNLVILVGSVDDSPNSQLNRSRQDIADEGVLTIGELIAKG